MGVIPGECPINNFFGDEPTLFGKLDHFINVNNICFILVKMSSLQRVRVNLFQRMLMRIFKEGSLQIHFLE
jgi:hypothetical protein